MPAQKPIYPPSHIDDAYSAEFYVRPVPGLHSGLKGKMRPALSKRRHAFLIERERASRISDADAFTANIMNIIVEQVESWEPAVGPPSPKSSEVNETNAQRLHPEIILPLVEQIIGTMPAEAEMAAAKNSPAG